LQIRRNDSQAWRNNFKAGRNENQIQRNKIQIQDHAFSIPYVKSGGYFTLLPSCHRRSSRCSGDATFIP
jgi:hypothetical protein